jgi:hypothetical protein
MSQVLVILDSDTLSVVDWYSADSPIVPVTPGIRLEVPEGLTWDIVKGVVAEDGTIGLIQDLQKSEVKTDAQWAQLRAERNARLTASDWTQLEDSRERKDVWANYRQELRDLPNNLTDPTQVVWPAPPS